MKCYRCGRKVTKINKKGSNKGVCKDCIKLDLITDKLENLFDFKLTPLLIEKKNLKTKLKIT